jgi:hypothetical protein
MYTLFSKPKPTLWCIIPETRRAASLTADAYKHYGSSCITINGWNRNRCGIAAVGSQKKTKTKKKPASELAKLELGIIVCRIENENPKA